VKPDIFSDKPEDLRRLAELDPAAEHTLPSDSTRQKIFERITTSDRPADAKPLDLGRRRAPFAHPLRWALAAVAAVAVAALIVIAPFGAETSTSAFATWTPVPGKISADMNQVLDSYCENPSTDPDGPGTYIPPCEIVAKEQRGEVGFVAAETAGGGLKTRIYIDGQEALSSHSSGKPVGTLAPEEVRLDMQAGRASLEDYENFGDLDHPERIVTTIIGHVGSEVASVEIAVNAEISDPNESEMFPVQATVENGIIAAWWPAKEKIAIHPNDGLVFNVTLKNGEVISNVPRFSHHDED